MKRIHIIGRKNSGKTTLIVELVTEFTRRGYRVGTIKHTHHNHELDTPGKDSYCHREAGSVAVGILTRSMNAVFWQQSDNDPAVNKYEPFNATMDDCDLVLVEGDSQANAPIVEVFRLANGSSPMAASNSNIDAVVTDDMLNTETVIWKRSDLKSVVDNIESLLELEPAMDLNHLRQEYTATAIDVDSVDPCPFRQFESWFGEASSQNVLEPNAMVVSTVDSNNQPTQRTVLLKYFDKSGFVFFTNYDSRKAKQIAANKHVSLLFPWYALQRQVEINGIVEKVSAADSLKYFALRPRGSQLGAWVSQQSAVVSNRSLLHNKLAELKKKFANGEVPKPPAWGGFRVKPARIEFWQGGKDRIHDRIEYARSTDDLSWIRQRLSP